MVKFWSSISFTKYPRELYERLHKEGHNIGFIEKRSLWIAQTFDRLHTLKRQYSTTKPLRIDCEMFKSYKIKRKKVRIIGDCYVEEILTEKHCTEPSDRVIGAVTSKEYVCLKTKSITNSRTNIPTVHNLEERFYIQPLADHSVSIGGFLRQSKPVFSNGVPDNFIFHFYPIIGMIFKIDVDFISQIYAMRLTHTGEDGFMPYIPSEVSLGFVYAASSEKITVNYIREPTYEINIVTKRFKAHPNVCQSIEMDHTVLLYIN
ncbi:unnamed protein product [Adineta steineri]|uniref:Uncharacterized protein n=1 Tax=Adineta steineri TaxID=433720 RepID=A0A819JVV8_9BILA|nr:unnamed protein product [Adineta steineri]CAF3935612.1 unnamed protein product [Adineta steineri]